MRRLTVLAAAALGFSACMLENPGVDPILATARDRAFQILGIDFGIDVKARAVRENGKVRFYLDNIGAYPLDTLEVLVQISSRPPVYQSNTGGYGGWPLFEPRPSAERFVRVLNLDQNETADLGASTLDYAGDMRDLHFHLVALGFSSGARKRSNPRMGIYEGRYSRSGPGFASQPKQGPLRGIVSHEGVWSMWSAADESQGTFRGTMAGDTIRFAAFGMYEFNPGLESHPILARQSGDSLILALGGGPADQRDTLQAVLGRLAPAIVVAHDSARDLVIPLDPPVEVPAR